ncbi:MULTISPECIES: transporter substrate-binding domain-containing protein [unclassified Clostridium]|uniref:transporter substrate-binding domain-containing protein n=1 Tax=unclassified Clostridium TaxID=2614128 RepID=UPI000EBBFFB4|nr:MULTISPECIES: transporter substrate-binding domain-containing protein [unclassified Clostridium]HCQ88633.1 amino acid ABC transporter substrate-binding protein [Clostridium sp.]
MRTRSKKLLIALSTIVLGVTLFSGCGAKNVSEEPKNGEGEKVEKIIKVGVSTEYFPWCFKQEDKLQGFEIDVWNEIGKRANYKIEFKVSKFSGLMGMLDSGQIDTVAHQMSTNEERRVKYDFSETYAYSKYKFVIPKESNISKVEDLKEKKVGCVLGGNGEKTIKELNKSKDLNLDIVTYDGTPMEKDVEVGRIDAGWLSEVKAKTTIEKGNLDLKIADINTGVFEINQYPFRKEEASKEIIENVNKAIKSMHEDGTFSKISNQWFELDTTKENN